MKRVLIMSSSPRKHGNSDTLCDAFLRGALECGNQVEKVFLREKSIGYCTACYACKQNGGVCAIRDDMAEILEKLHWADVIVMASPVYFYSVNAQIKTVIDRTVCQWRDLKNKEFYFILTAAEENQTAFTCAVECLRGYVCCFAGSEEKGVLCAGGVYQPGEVRETPWMEEAYRMGKQV